VQASSPSKTYYVEGDFSLRDTTRRRRDARELELAEEVVVLGVSMLNLRDLDEHTKLVVSVGQEGLGLLRQHCGVALDESTICNGLIQVVGLVGLLAVEEVGHVLDNARDMGGANNEDDLVHVTLVDPGAAEDLLDGFESAAKRSLQSSLKCARAVE
jgi:hypothetical protein